MASAGTVAQHHERRKSSSSSSSDDKKEEQEKPQPYNTDSVQIPLGAPPVTSPDHADFIYAPDQAPQYSQPSAPEYYNQQPQGYENQQAPGYYNQQPQGYGNQQPQGYYNQQPQGYGNQQPQGYYNQQPQGYGNQQAPGYYNQQPQGYGNQQPPGYYNQQAYNPNILYQAGQNQNEEQHYNREPSRLAAFFKSDKWNAYNDRNNFIKKVYGILSCQLLFTVIFVGIVVSSESLRDGIKDTAPVVFVAMALTFVLMIAIFCCRKVAKTVPYNYIALFAFTVLESYIVAFVCAFYEPLIVLSAAIMTMGVTIALTVYAWKTKKDFTTCGGMIFVICMSFLLFFIFLIFLYNDYLYMIFCLFAVIMYGFFIIYDTQLIAGGRYAELGYDDYILGSLMLYIDIIGLFMYLLSIMGKK